MVSISYLSTSAETVQKPILHVEARVKSDGDNVIIRTDIIREEVTRWLIDNFAVLTLGQELRSFDDLKEPHAHALDSVKVTECTGGELESGAYRLENVELDVQAYQLRGQAEPESSSQTQQSESTTDNSEDGPRARTIALPNKELDGIWESLLFDQPIQSTLLRAICRMLSFSSRKLDTWIINWNRVILLWGPPGTGKTSLCRGLAQKLAIRLGKQFPQSKLVEINAHSLGSKFFSESGKLVSRMFDSIEAMLDEEEDTFVCVFVDEVETLTARREQALSGNEPFDAMRAVNALLRALDRLRHHPNVVVLCTSNLITALDAAFLDRVDIKQFIPQPSARVIYEIYKSCLEDLARCGIVEGSTFDVIQLNPADPQTPLQYICQPAETLILPGYDEMLLAYQMFSDSIPKQLADVASASVGLSGRALRRLPALSLVLHTHGTRCNVRDAVAALRKGVTAELQAKAEANGEVSQGGLV
ncbi:pachytene checkpoint component Pch2 [Thermoascus aurantiacus ATCC 26904]